MSTSYEVRRNVLESAGAVRIDEMRYVEFERAQAVLSHALYMEEKLDQVLENFVEYEDALLGIGLSRMVFERHDLIEFDVDISLINRRLINLLSMCRAYLDQLPHHVNEICSPSRDGSAIVRDKMKEEYTSVFGYRVMEALRNYVQHRGSPIESSEFSQTGEWLGEKQVQVFTVDPFLEPARLSRDAKFKKNVLIEMTQRGEAVHLKPLVRQYISSIEGIHRLARELVSDCITRKREILESAIKVVDLRDATGAERMSAVVVSIADDGTHTARMFLSLEPERRREILYKRNMCVGDLDHRFVSGACRDDT